ncbi:CO(2)-response secreted protease-like [Humulus lupulus]|uniref:CO(2)-response secreted protease-like n=1 Tax=Humulus lupulus TaxID=3486 RepID=UPI002B40FEC8|nr:CO(2)-response secreted protease-like [Humulus lupulus]
MMTTIVLLLLSFLSLQWLLISGSSTTDQIPKHYVIYMGAPKPLSNGNEVDSKVADQSAHLQLLSSIVPSEEKERISLIHHYHHAFRGFSAMLTDNEASFLLGHSDVVSVFPDDMVELQTTRSWDFIEGRAGKQSQWGLDKHITSNIIIGIIDSGIWPESQSFNDKGLGPIPSKWKGVCTEALDFDKSNCNRKLIGARYYLPANATEEGTPRDSNGHGTHVASTAAGSVVSNTNFFGLASGTARGGAPSARIASYRVCWSTGCSIAAILKAIDDAINDGVDIISISIGYVNGSREYLNDPISIGAFHAEQNGVLVVLSGGNNGPDPYTVGHTAPWMFTVAASTIDRDFRSMLLLGNGKILKGTGINFSKLSRSPIYPIIFGKDAAINSSVASNAGKFYSGTLDIKKVAGKIVVCVDDENPLRLRGNLTKTIEDVQGEGLVMITEDDKISPNPTGIFPWVQVGKIAESHILINYINSTEKPTATILPTVEVPRFYKPAPVVAIFSSRGPGPFTENILKPDIMAPGVAILAATVPNKIEDADGNTPSEFGFSSGTSMACPHVSGAAAFIKSVHPTWTSSMIKSALMTTATAYDNTGKPLTNSSKYMANPHEAGVGELNHMKALNPGLVFETTTQDYFNFLCYYGYTETDITSIFPDDKNFQCPNNSNDQLISDINYPSISIGKLKRHQSTPSRVIKRTVTNVGPSNSTYIARVHSPKGLVVKVNPEKIVFSKGLKRVPFEVSFDGMEAPSGYSFGHITWSDGRHSVRVVYTVNVE